MPVERMILIAVAFISILSLIYIPKDQIRKALVSFLAFHTTTWSTSIILTQTGKAVYPVREFIKATNVNFIPQFIFYPTIFMWFILIYPKNRHVLIQSLHYFLFVSLMLWFIFFTTKLTDIYKFPDATDYSILANGYPRNFFQFLVCHLFVDWFFKKEHSA